MSDHSFGRFILIVLLLLAVSSPVFAAVPADVWNIGHLVTGGGRTRIVQFCVLVMGIALFILMRKIND